MLKVGIVGATGYVGVELIRILLNHPMVKVHAISSTSFKDEKISSIYKSFYNATDLICEDTDKIVDSCDVIFTALPHGLSEDIAKKAIDQNKILIDLGADFRLNSEEEYEEWYGKKFTQPSIHPISVYGLPEFNRHEVKNTKLIANPGCYPTSISLGLMPALLNKKVEIKNIICDSKSGVTGAGRGLTLKTHYPETNENFAPYAIGAHRHTPEIEQTLSQIAGENIEVTFTPHLLPINRGICSTIYCDLKEKDSLKDIYELYVDFYKNEKFVHVLPLGETAEIKHVKYSNNCFISLHLNYRKDKLIVVSCIDNMIKGAAGQAIQNLNIILGLEENVGLNLISPSF